MPSFKASRVVRSPLRTAASRERRSQVARSAGVWGSPAMPATARWVAKKIGLRDYSPNQVADTETNLMLGTSYLRLVMESLDNHPVLASAAYNAGPGRAQKWRGSQPLEGAIYAETIPFAETRDYVKKVMSNSIYYSILFNDQPQSLKQRLGVVMIQVLRQCGALARLLPEVDRLYGVPQRADYHPEVDTGVHLELVLDTAAARGEPLPVRFAALTHDLGKGTTPADILPRHIGHEARSLELLEGVCARLRVPTDCRDLARLVARYHSDVHRVADLKATALVKLLEQADALRRPQRFDQLLAACTCDFLGRGGDWPTRPYPSPDRLRHALAAVQTVDAAAIAKACPDPRQIPEHLHRARVAAVSQALADFPA